MSALLSSKFLDLNSTWQGMTALSIAQKNGHRKIKEIIQAECRYRDQHPELFPATASKSPSPSLPQSPPSIPSRPTPSQRKRHSGSSRQLSPPSEEANPGGDWRGEPGCPVCLGEMRSVKIHQCVSGHLICHHCRQNLQNCPVCNIIGSHGDKWTNEINAITI